MFDPLIKMGFSFSSIKVWYLTGLESNATPMCDYISDVNGAEVFSFVGRISGGKNFRIFLVTSGGASVLRKKIVRFTFWSCLLFTGKFYNFCRKM